MFLNCIPDKNLSEECKQNKKHPLPQNKTPKKQTNKHTKQNKKLNKLISVSLILHFYICTVRNDTPGECEVKPKEIVTNAVSF